MLRLLWLSLGAGLTWVSLAYTYYGDEGFHLTASMLILAGKAPYQEFFYQHVPYYAYLNAAVFALFGQGWRAAHVVSALATAGAVALLADFAARRVRPEQRLLVGVAATLLAAMQPLLVQFGTVAQPYGVTLLLSALAFRAAVHAVEERSLALRALYSALCGALAAACLGMSLLCLPLLPTFLIWMLFHTQHAQRTRIAAAFSVGALLSLLPLAIVLSRVPGPAYFNVIGYHLFHRSPALSEAALLSLRALASATLGSVQGLAVLGLSAVAIRTRFVGLAMAEPVGNEGSRSDAKVWWLCGWVSLISAAFALCTMPALPQYFLTALVFASPLAAVGLLHLLQAVRRGRGALIAGAAATTLGLGYHSVRRLAEPSPFQWSTTERVAALLNQHVPRSKPVWTNPLVYIAAQRLPPKGLENPFSRALDLPRDLLRAYAITPREDLEHELLLGQFHGVVMRESDPLLNGLSLRTQYTHAALLDGYVVLWGPRNPTPTQLQP